MVNHHLYTARTALRQGDILQSLISLEIELRGKTGYEPLLEILLSIRAEYQELDDNIQRGSLLSSDIEKIEDKIFYKIQGIINILENAEKTANELYAPH